ncbi:MAG TPA: ERAP1-like C-terminal domain-containing protein, partial [Usitatibacter sp.]
AARALAFRWIANRAAISANMAGPALDTAARFADEATYARLEAALVATQDQRDRRTLIDAIAKVRDARLRERALAIAFMKKDGAEVLNGGQVHDLVSFAAMDDGSRAAAFHFVAANFDAIHSKIPKDSEAWLIESFAGLCAPVERDAFRAFFEPRAAGFLGGELGFRQTMESIELCVAARGR